MVEIGAGLGGFAKVLVESVSPILVSTPAPELQRVLAENLIPGLEIAEPILLPLETLPDIEPLPKSVVMSNVLEHIEEDTGSLSSLLLMESVTHLAIVVPAHEWAYTKLDAALGHYRRYTTASLRKVLEDAGWRIESIRYFNPLGGIGMDDQRQALRAINDLSLADRCRRASSADPPDLRSSDEWKGVRPVGDRSQHEKWGC